MFQIVEPSPVAFCMAWHARGFEQNPVHGGTCCWCGRPVAVEEHWHHLLAAMGREDLRNDPRFQKLVERFDPGIPE